MRKRRSCLWVFSACLPMVTVGSVLVALAQLPPNVVLVRGKIEAAEPAALRVRTGDGSTRIAITEKTGYAAMSAARLEEIKAGEYVGITARPAPDGGWRAVEVRIFPEAMRGLSEGHFPWDLPGTTMTNAVVGDVVQKMEGPLLTLTPKGQSVQILVPHGAMIARVDLGKADLVQVGAGAVVVASKAPDGALTALRVYVGQGGLIPAF